eukprot:TRINITY_DN39569_c0_g1_i1.p1 TRINITY_DN39569_c0_g1~~TRINITY_DN39569_c0_g1_i1.p1  ORF type:complete len:505 (+),score=154.33 TRINITY_DN39569_c0_g1_i1:54-1568(+)
MLAAVSAAAVAGAPARPNILYLMADDMRPQLGCYGHSYMASPNIDALAASGLVFEFAYTQYAYCAPSRNSFLSGRRPERTQVMNFNKDFRQLHGDSWVALPQLFKNQGYFTTSAGKIYHDGMDDPLSWSYPSNQTRWIVCGKGDALGINGNYCAVTNTSAEQHTDEELALSEGLKRMELAVASGKPWWVSIGVHRPHWPSRVPQGWLGPEQYPGDVVKAPVWPWAPVDAPWMSGNWYGGDYKDAGHGCPNCTVPTAHAIEYRRWYYAATSYSDHMLGMALRKLEELGAADSTITVFHADHGYQLGELNEWSKKTDTELATRVPLIIRVPWKKASVGKRTQVKAELIDLYRTLAELTGIDATGIQTDVQGHSLAAVFDEPSAMAEKVAYSQIGSCACKQYTRNNWTGYECDAGRCLHTPIKDFNYMGYSLRNADYRYTVWVAMDNQTARVDWDKTAAHELYLLADDKGLDFDFPAYSHNVAGLAEHNHTVERLYQELKAQVQTWY